ncbi:glycosyltransferase involved in cell wall biosynthesis [Salinibacter ruber]|uniref:Glycosyltransferase involved in cell wall biosynthesis n=1 Tax=Salinibacter ruber TaxID=146919 RepID=A0A9X2Q8S3_9BACT|nr:glycosyltransferase family 2 protein [Salinibacter ruber]MCS3678771.1 glycosyltransferase involved in cell wall biosynthesis [Salinibacter ruber]MCS3682388.1 glycosyltransferase involved in cell wall biosynthesis [Salinibacter ruber]
MNTSVSEPKKSAPTLDDLPPPPEENTGWPWTEQSDPLPETQPNGEPWPKISIVTPSYNQGQFIEETIRSVLLQGYPNLEYIVMDGGSSDHSTDILEKYDPWIDYWESQEDRGQAHAINRGFARAGGRIFAWLNSDDWFALDALHAAVAALSDAPEDVAAVVGKGHMVDKEGAVVYTPETTELTRDALLDWMEYGHFIQPACVFRKSAWDEAGPLREDLTYCFDVALWLSMADQAEFRRIDETIAYALKHEEAKTIAQRNRSRAETIVVAAEYGGTDVALKEINKLVDRLEYFESKVEAVVNHPLYKVYRGIKRIFKGLNS